MKAKLVMALHFHQPVGNFDDVIERACDKCYIPFLRTLKKYPDIKMTFHFSGCLLEWAQEKRPEIFEMVSEMISSGQVEIMTGGFYEPILVAIPHEDRIRQIDMLTSYIKKKFSTEVKGAWVAERVWEPTLPAVFSDSGVEYVILDDTHFLYAGVPKEKTYGYYITEDNGKRVAVFSSDKFLRYSMPFKLPHETMDYMKEIFSSRDNVLFVYGDDGEKFGEWPGTHKWVYEEKWLENFFNELLSNREWLETIKLAEAYREFTPLGRVYLPTASYEEMLEWSLPADMQEYMEDVLEDIEESGKKEYYKPFIRGGFWRNFLTKYSESNRMNKRVLYASKRLSELREEGKGPDLLAEAEKELFRSQCNCSYWHGVFGGLYLYHLRNAVYEHLIKSERIMDEVVHGKKSICQASSFDIGSEGREEIVLENNDLALFFDPSTGGALKELDHKKLNQNFINTLSRKKEAYHRKMLKKIEEENLEGEEEIKTIHDDVQVTDKSLKDHLIYDTYERTSFIDHFLAKDLMLDEFIKGDYREEGDFAGSAYEHSIERGKNKIKLLMEREGRAAGSSLLLRKEVSFEANSEGFSVLYRLKNTGEEEVDLLFAPEINLTMPFGDSQRYSIFTSNDDKKARKLQENISEEGVKGLRVADEESSLSFEVSFSREVNLWHFPVKTVSLSEKAYELNYQASAFLVKFPIALKKGEEASVSVKVRLPYSR